MPKITETPEQFFDIVLLFLYDMIVNSENSVIKREDLLDMVEKLKKRGMKPQLMKHRLSLKSNLRIDYKRIKEIFYNPKSPAMIVNINTTSVNENAENKDFYRLKDQVRQVIHLIKKQKYKSPGRIVSELQIDKIINHVLKEEKNNG